MLSWVGDELLPPTIWGTPNELVGETGLVLAPFSFPELEKTLETVIVISIP